MRQRRWYGDADEAEQPDVGDVIVHVNADGVWSGGAIYRVLGARPIRGPEHQPNHLMLTTERGHVGDLTPEGGGRVFPAHPCGPRCGCGWWLRDRPTAR